MAEEKTLKNQQKTERDNMVEVQTLNRSLSPHTIQTAGRKTEGHRRKNTRDLKEIIPSPANAK